MFTRHLVYLSAFFLLISFSKNLYAQSFSLPSTSTTGVYSITYSYSGMGVILIDELVNGSWRNVGGGQPSGVINVTKTQSGTYSYSYRTCMSSCSTNVSVKTITVTLSSPANPIVCTGAANTITYCYDDLGRVKTAIHPNGVKNNYEYDAADNRTKKESTN